MSTQIRRTSVVVRSVVCFAILFLSGWLFRIRSRRKTVRIKRVDSSDDGFNALFGVTERSYRSSCGHSWQKHYSSLHSKILHGNLPARYLVSVAPETGTADRLTGLVTLFLYSVMTGRAFLHTTNDFEPDWDTSCSFPYIRTATRGIPDNLLQAVKTTYKGIHEYRGVRTFAPASEGKDYYPWFMYNANKKMVKEAFVDSNFSQYPRNAVDVETILSSSNRGASYAMFSNPHKASLLGSMGFSPESAFACSFFFLFRPRREICSSSCMEIARRMRSAGDKGILRVGVHVRLGDHVFTKDSVQPEIALAHLDCANQLLRMHAADTHHLVYFISDSLAVRRFAASVFNGTLITDTSDGVGHTDCRNKHNTLDSCSESGVVGVTRRALAELYLFSMTDFHIITPDSGFGAVGAAMSLPSAQHDVFRFGSHGHTYVVGIGQKRICSVEPDPVYRVSEAWAGI